MAKGLHLALIYIFVVASVEFQSLCLSVLCHSPVPFN